MRSAFRVAIAASALFLQVLGVFGADLSSPTLAPQSDALASSIRAVEAAKDRAVREDAIRMLARHGAEAAPALLNMAETHTDHTVRLYALEALGMMRKEAQGVRDGLEVLVRRQEAPPAFKKSITGYYGEWYEFRIRALCTLLEIGASPDGVLAIAEPLLQESIDNRTYYRREILDILKRMPSGHARTLSLFKQIVQENPAQRREALEVLGTWGAAAAPAKSAMAELAKHEDEVVRAAAEAVLLQIALFEPDNIEYLRDVLELQTSSCSLEGRTRKWTSASVSALTTLMDDNSRTIRLRSIALIAQAGISAKPALPILRKLVDDPDADVAAAAMDGIAGLAAELPEALEVLVKLATDAKRQVPQRNYTICRIGELGLDAVPVLTALKTAADSASPDANMEITETARRTVQRIEELERAMRLFLQETPASARVQGPPDGLLRLYLELKEAPLTESDFITYTDLGFPVAKDILNVGLREDATVQECNELLAICRATLHASLFPLVTFAFPKDTPFAVLREFERRLNLHSAVTRAYFAVLATPNT